MTAHSDLRFKYKCWLASIKAVWFFESFVNGAPFEQGTIDLDMSTLCAWILLSLENLIIHPHKINYFFKKIERENLLKNYNYYGEINCFKFWIVESKYLSDCLIFFKKSLLQEIESGIKSTVNNKINAVDTPYIRYLDCLRAREHFHKKIVKKNDTSIVKAQKVIHACLISQNRLFVTSLLLLPR